MDLTKLLKTILCTRDLLDAHLQNDLPPITTRIKQFRIHLLTYVFLVRMRIFERMYDRLPQGEKTLLGMEAIVLWVVLEGDGGRIHHPPFIIELFSFKIQPKT